MFSLLPKSRAAAEKAGLLSDLEVALLDLHLTAAFRRPDSHLHFVDHAVTVINGRIYEIFVIQIEVAMLSLVISDRGRVGITDFHITNLFVEPPSLVL
jgi:hypothetical protein